MSIQIYQRDAFNFMVESMPDGKEVDLVIADPEYDWDADKRLAYHIQMTRVCRGAVIVFCPPENQWQPYPDQYLFWIKPISTKNTSRKYSRFVEMIQVFGEGSWDADRHWSQYTNVFTDTVDSRVHPFRKPPSLIERLILNHSQPEDYVFDPFAGSGVVAEVCARMGRNYIGCDVDEECVRRIDQWASNL